MPSARPSQAAIERAIRAWTACGQPGRGVRVEPDGSVTVLGETPEKPLASPANDDPEAAWAARFGAKG